MTTTPTRAPASLTTRWRQRIHGEYREMPDLKLTVPQAMRLWGIDAALAQQVLEQLCDVRLLARTSDGAYRRV